jgi:hypothetical protein
VLPGACGANADVGGLSYSASLQHHGRLEMDNPDRLSTPILRLKITYFISFHLFHEHPIICSIIKDCIINFWRYFGQTNMIVFSLTMVS